VLIYAAKHESVLNKLSKSTFLHGDHNWGCVDVESNESRPMYRQIASVRLDIESGIILVETVAVPFVHLFESSSISLYIPPNYNPRQNPTHNDDEVGVANIDDYSFFEITDSYNFDYNYDADSKGAADTSIRLSEDVYCENCYFSFEAGFIFQLDIDYELYMYPVVDYLKIAVTGDASASAYLRANSPSKGKSDMFELSDRMNLPGISILIGSVYLFIKPGLQLFAQYEIVDDSMDMSMFAGFSAGASAELGIELPDKNSDLNVLAGLTWYFDGTPLSVYNSQNGGKFNPRIYLIPRIYISPYGLFDLFVDIKPYVGVEVYDAGSSVSNPDAASGVVSEYNAESVPTKPALPSLYGGLAAESFKIKVSKTVCGCPYLTPISYRNTLPLSKNVLICIH
jgi:hypothetical protein